MKIHHFITIDSIPYLRFKLLHVGKTLPKPFNLIQAVGEAVLLNQGANWPTQALAAVHGAFDQILTHHFWRN